MTCFATSLLQGWVEGRGVLLGNLGGGVPHGTPNPALISHQKCYSPHPFSDLASNIISSLSDQKLFRLERQHKIHSEFAWWSFFLIFIWNWNNREVKTLSKFPPDQHVRSLYRHSVFGPKRYKYHTLRGGTLYKRVPGGGTLGISGWGCAAGTLEPLTYTRASSAEFCYPILE